MRLSHAEMYFGLRYRAIKSGNIVSEDATISDGGNMIKRFRKKITALLLVGVLVLTPATNSIKYVNADEDESIEDLEQKKKEAEEKIKEAKNKLSGLEDDRDQVSDVVTQLDNQIGEYTEKISELNDQKSVIQTEIAVTQLKIQNALYEEQLQYNNMKDRIQYAYENGDTAYIDALMNVDDFKNMLNESEYASQISAYDQNQLERLFQIRSSIEIYKDLLSRNLEKVDELAGEAKNEQEALQVMVDGKKDLLVAYNIQINETEGEISDLEAQTEAFDAQILQITAAAAAAEEARRQEEMRQREEAARLRREAEERRRQEEEERRRQEEEDDDDDDTATDSDASRDDDDEYSDDYYDDDAPTYYTGGSLLWPCPSSSYISSYFGGRSAPVAGASTYHQAIDIGCDMYSSIVASESGTVTSTGYNVARGYYIVVYHGEGISTLYQHLSDFAVSSGDYVSRGQVIAYSGMTGYASGPHLHYEVIVGDERVDPLLYTSP